MLPPKKYGGEGGGGLMHCNTVLIIECIEQANELDLSGHYTPPYPWKFLEPPPCI